MSGETDYVLRCIELYERYRAGEREFEMNPREAAWLAANLNNDFPYYTEWSNPDAGLDEPNALRIWLKT